jgi:hypothetical protein
VTPEEFKQHLTTECDALEYAERGCKETKGSLDLLTHLRWYSNGFQVSNSNQLKSSFAVILDEILFLARRKQDKWTLAVISPSPIQMNAYFKHFSKVYGIQTLVKMNSYLTCKQLHDVNEMAHFPLDISKVDYIQCT